MKTFYLGTHHPGWISKAGVPLCVSDAQIKKYKTLPVGIAPVMIDSGGFKAIQMHGQWISTPHEYAARCRRYNDEIGTVDWMASQDWMCEPFVIAGGRGPHGEWYHGTGLTLDEHQRRTVGNYLELKALEPDLPFAPTIQGYLERDYHACVDMYEAAGVDLTKEPVVGLGSVCRRESTKEAQEIVGSLYARGIHTLHGFGVKTTGLALYGDELETSDSTAWSAGARKRKIRLDGCETHQNCANCMTYALQWRANLLDGLANPRPPVVRRIPRPKVDTIPLWEIDEDTYDIDQPELGEAVGL